MKMPAVASGATVLFTIAFLLIAVVIGIPDQNGIDSLQEPEDDGFLIDWHPEGPDYDFFIKADTGCAVEHEGRGRLSHESGMGLYSFLQSPVLHGLASAIRNDDSAHAGSLNSAHLTGPVWGTGANYGFSLQMEFQQGWNWLFAAFATDQPSDPLQVWCENGAAGFLFYQADHLVPVVSSTSTGGIGAESGVTHLGLQVGLNKADVYRIETSGDLVVLRLSDHAVNSISSLTGEITIRTPDSMEVVSLDKEGNEPFRLTREWTTPGEYELIIDRVALNRTPLQGVLAGFVLQENHGT
jgi:hypothetical protein